jgi:CheY-like chemotaxis protein
MESVGTLAGGIAHDFNNALTGIMGFADLLRMRFAEDPKTLADLGEITRSAERAAELTRQLLTFARKQIVEPVNLNLNEVVTGLLKLVTNVVGEHIDVKASLAADLPTISADRGQIEQVILNLCLNARDAMPSGGHLLLETAEVTMEGEYLRKHPYVTKGPYTMLVVSDTGAGMDEATQERIFEPFFTTKGPDKGTGLGMAVVYGIVKQHKGVIHVYSELGKGSTFRIYFPSIEAPSDAESTGAAERIVGGKETILLAEDDGSIRTLAERILRELGYSVLSACDGEEAVDLFRRHREEISLAILDVVMPKAGGVETIGKIREESPGMKSIFMSGYPKGGIHGQFVIKPDTPFLAKPFTSAAMARKVRDVLDG